MRTRFKLVFAGLVLAVLVAACDETTTPPDNGKVHGTVWERGGAVRLADGESVSMDRHETFNKRTTTTGADGTFDFMLQPEGCWFMTAAGDSAVVKVTTDQPVIVFFNHPEEDEFRNDCP